MAHRILLISMAIGGFSLGLAIDARIVGRDMHVTWTPNAIAVVGNPLTPLSVAGVARRTTRRAIRRSTIYVPALPAGCVTVAIDGETYHRCGTTYYQAHQGQYVVVNID